jgi:hypothetical protein|tara:strand:- start:2262 stop:4319 length:2058 start_codon:yes stop_codon:yes gene_type:complete
MSAQTRTYSHADLQQRLVDVRNAKGADSPEERIIVNAMRNNLETASRGDNIDTQRGASLGVRAQVGNARTPEDKLATMRGTHPEAIPYKDDNFLANNPTTGQPFLYNPEGLDSGDVAEYGREVVSGLAGVGSAVAVAPAALTGAAPYVAGGFGAATAGALYDSAMNNMGTVDPRTIGERVEEFGVEAVLGMVPYDKIAAPAQNAFRKLVTGPAQEKIKNVVAKYDIKATAGTVGNGLLKSLEAGSQRVGAAMDNFKNAADDMYEGIDTVIDGFFTSMGGKTSQTDAGRMLVDRGQSFISTFRNESNSLYGLVDDFISPDSLVLPSNLKAAAKDLMFESKLGKLFQKDLAGQIVETIDADGAVRYSELAQIRTALGEMMSSQQGVGPSDIGTRKAGQLYEAITLDMKEMASKAGDEAILAWDTANDFYRAGSTTIDDVINPLMTAKNGKEWLSADDVMNKFKRMVSGDPDSLKRLDASGVVDADDMSKAGAGMLDDLGQGTPGSVEVLEDRLSPGRIPAQTSTKVIHEESKDLLFTRTSKEIFEDLQTLGAAVKETDSLVNRSGTANTAAILGTLTAAGAAVAGGDTAQMASVFLGSVVLPYLGSKGLQSRPFINWVVKGSKSGTGKEWLRAGARMAAKEGLMSLYTGITDSIPGANVTPGVLDEFITTGPADSSVSTGVLRLPEE